MVNHKYSTMTLIFLIGVLLIGIVSAGFENIQFCLTNDCDTSYAVESINNKPVFINEEFYIEIARGNVANMELIHKFGSFDAITNTWKPITSDGVYQTPTTAKKLSVKSSSNSDNATGIGARQVKLIGLNATWDEITEFVNLDGTNEVNTTNEFIRLYRLYVTSSGTYADQTQGSHVGTIRVQEPNGGSEWASINLLHGFALGQSEIGAYTIPRGKTGFLLTKTINVDSNKPVHLALFQRRSANDTTAPYDGTMRTIEIHENVATEIRIEGKGPLATLPEMTDIGFMAYVATGTGSAEVDMELLLIDN